MEARSSKAPEPVVDAYAFATAFTEELLRRHAVREVLPDVQQQGRSVTIGLTGHELIQEALEAVLQREDYKQARIRMQETKEESELVIVFKWEQMEQFLKEKQFLAISLLWLGPADSSRGTEADTAEVARAVSERNAEYRHAYNKDQWIYREMFAAFWIAEIRNIHILQGALWWAYRNRPVRKPEESPSPRSKWGWDFESLADTEADAESPWSTFAADARKKGRDVAEWQSALARRWMKAKR